MDGCQLYIIVLKVESFYVLLLYIK